MRWLGWARFRFGLKIEYEAVGVCEIDLNLAPLSMRRYPRKMSHIEPDEGDILKVPTKDLPEADILRSGPPCPPCSVHKTNEDHLRMSSTTFNADDG